MSKINKVVVKGVSYDIEDAKAREDIENMITEVTWEQINNIDDYIKAGVYDIAGTRWRNDGLPINNIGENATIAAKLFVTVTPEGATTYRHSIGQTLILTNAEGKETKVYTRNGNRTSTDGGVSYTITWADWSNLQSNINVKRVEDLDKLIDNGIYSGVWLRGTDVMTFVCVVINDYALSSSPRRVSQFIYGLKKASGNVEYLTRIGEGDTNIVWGEPKIINEDKISEMISAKAEEMLVAINSNARAIANEVTRATEAEGKLEDKIAKEKTALINGDIIVGQAREVYSRTGKVDTTTFLKRTTAGGTSVSDGVATLRQIGGNIVKNNLDIERLEPKFITMENRHGVIVVQPQSDGVVHGSVQLFVGCNSYIDKHVYYTSFILKSNVQSVIAAYAGVGYNAARRIVGGTIMPDVWTNISGVATFVLGDIANLPQLSLFPFGTSGATSVNNRLEIFSMLSVDLTEMFGAGNEPTKEECDRMFACMGALPQGLTIAQPTGLKSIGYNQWNPANVLLNKSIVENAIEDDVADRHIAIVECLPCKTGTGENNGYVIGYGEGDTWSDEGIEVYLTPLNPLEVDGELYLQKLDKEATYGTYVPQIKGYLLVVTPTTDKLCAHFHWSGDREITDYEEYVESNVALPTIPEMSEWGLAGISSSGTTVQDTIDLEKMVYTKRLTKRKLNDVLWTRYPADETHPYGFFVVTISGIKLSNIRNVFASSKYTPGTKFTVDKTVFGNIAGNGNVIYIVDSEFNDRAALNANLADVDFYLEIAPEEYPIVTKTAPNYIGSDYGVEEFTGSKVPLAANILFYMRSLVSETRNFLDRLMARLGISDATAVADKIADAIIPTTEETDVEPTTVIEE